MGTHQYSQLSGMQTVAPHSGPEQRNGFQICKCTRETFGCLIHPTGKAEWIASMRDSLVRTLARLEQEKELTESEADSSVKCSGQLTLLDLDSCSSRTVHGFGPKGETVLLPHLWRVDTPGVMEYLGRLMSVPGTTETGGGVSLPTLTVCGNYNRKGASPTSGDGLITVLKKLPTPTASEEEGGRSIPPGTSATGITPDGKKIQMGLKSVLKMRMPTLIARDARTAAGSQPKPGRKATSGDPLLWSMTKDLKPEQRRGLKLNPMWAAWYMGWPMTWFQVQ